MPEDHTTPTTVKEVGIHIGYIREDIAELKRTVTAFTDTAATKAELSSLEKRVSSLEKRDDSKKYFTRLEGRVVTAMLSLAVTILTIWKIFA